jgi:hypothetical protein
MLAQGVSFSTIAATVGCYPDYINRWKQRFEAERLTGLRAKYVGQCRPSRRPRWRRASWPRRGRHRPMAARTGAPASLRRCWASATCWSRACGGAPGCKSHRLERYMLSVDPGFEQKAPDVIVLYLNPRVRRSCWRSRKSGHSSIRSPGSGIAALARTRRTPRL